MVFFTLSYQRSGSRPRIWSATFSDIVPVRPKPAPMTFTLTRRGCVALELLAQLQLLELTRCGNRDGLHELVGVGQPEPGEVHFQVSMQVIFRRALTFPEDDGGQGPLVPLLVGDGDYTSLGDGRVGHKRVLQLDRGDPLPPALYEVFAA